MEGTILIKCSCKNEFQDTLYGKNIRVHNVGGKDKHKKHAFCTVCKDKKTL